MSWSINIKAQCDGKISESGRVNTDRVSNELGFHVLLSTTGKKKKNIAIENKHVREKAISSPSVEISLGDIELLAKE